MATPEVEAVSVVVVVLVVAARAEEAALAVASAELLISEVALLVRPTQLSEERPTVEAESGSARIILRLHFRASRLSPRMRVPLSHRDPPWCRVQVHVRLET